jgi:hypothetical protein
MSDDDLIRRGDAIKAVDDWQGDWSCTVLALSALPAVQPRVKPLEWRECNEHDEATDRAESMGQEYSVGYDDNWGWYAYSETLGMDLANAPTRDAAKAAAQAHYDARTLSALDNNNNPRKGVMPDDPPFPWRSDIGPGDQAVAGAAQIKVAWPEDARSLLAEADARIAWESLGFGADFAERVEAALESDPPEEIGILQASVEDQDRKIADLTRQLQGQPRRQSDVNADTWQPIATAPKDRVIDLWSAEGGRYPDAIWDVSCDAEGWTDANDHRSLAGYRFTHWMDRPAGPMEGARP